MCAPEQTLIQRMIALGGDGGPARGFSNSDLGRMNALVTMVADEGKPQHFVAPICAYAR
jgi:hypothetical protein